MTAPTLEASVAGQTIGSTFALPAFAATAGNFIALLIEAAGEGSITSVSDTAGNVYQRAGSARASGGLMFEEWFTANPITGHAANVATIGASDSFAYWNVSQAHITWPGATSIALDAQGAVGSDAGTAYVTGNITVGAESLMLSQWIDDAGTTTMSNGTGTIAANSGDSRICAYRIPSSGGSYSLGLTGAGTPVYWYQLTSFKAVMAEQSYVPSRSPMITLLSM
jgi:hypothetical protein